MLSKCKQFLFLIRHPSCYSYIQVKSGESLGREKEKDQLTIEIWISGDTGILLLMKGKLSITKVKSSRRFCLLSTSVVNFK